MVIRAASQHGIAVAQSGEGDTLAAVWSAASSAGIPHPGLVFAVWAEPALVGGVLPTILANCADIGALLGRLHRFHPLFGPERLMWGTGFPGATRNEAGRPTLRQELDLIRKEMEFFTAADREKILGRNAAQLWRFEQS